LADKVAAFANLGSAVPWEKGEAAAYIQLFLSSFRARLHFPYFVILSPDFRLQTGDLLFKTLNISLFNECMG
jgi:hypothetical protein